MKTKRLIKSRLPEVEVDDYDIKSAKKIYFRNMPYWIMPRYEEHYVSNEYEDLSLNIFNSLIFKDCVVVDIGSHFGAYSLVAHSFEDGNGPKSVYSFEPVPENRQILKKNLIENSFSVDKVYEYAISNKSYDSEFKIPWASDSAGLYEHPNAKTIKKIKVKVKSLDDLFNDQSIDIIKIDTEGNEVKVLEGAKKTLSKNPNIKLLVEFNPSCLRSAGESPANLIKLLHSYGFHTYFIDDKNNEIRQLKDPNNWENILGDNEYVNILCQKGMGLHILASFHSGDLGGAELATLEAIKLIKRMGNVVDVVVPRKGTLYNQLTADGFSTKVVEYTAWSHSIKININDLHNEDYLNIRATESIIGLIKEINYDVVLGSTITLPWPAIASAASRKPYIWMIHEYGDIDHNFVFDYSYRDIIEIINSLSTIAIVNSRSVLNHIQNNLGHESEKFKQIYYAIDYENVVKKIKNIKPINNYKKDFYNILILGRITKSKGQIDAVLAIKDLVESGHKVNLNIVGDIGDKKYYNLIKSLIKKNNLSEFITFKPFTNNPYREIIQSDALLVCSTNEAFGRITSESMICNRPVVAANKGGTLELIKHGKTGLLYNSGDIKDLSRQILILKDNNKLYKRITENAKKNIHEILNTERIINELSEVIRLSLKNGPQPPYIYDKIFETYIKIESDYRDNLYKANLETIKLKTDIQNILDSKSWKAISVYRKIIQKIKNPL